MAVFCRLYISKKEIFVKKNSIIRAFQRSIDLCSISQQHCNIKQINMLSSFSTTYFSEHISGVLYYTVNAVVV